MRRRLAKASLVLVGLLAVAQLVRPGQANPAPDPSHAIDAEFGATSTLVVTLNRACGDCHSSHAAAWPWYAQVAPLSWVVALAERDGRKAVDYSEWTGYAPEQRRALLLASCQDAIAGTMPVPIYTRIRPDARLTAADVEIICAAAREP